MSAPIPRDVIEGAELSQKRWNIPASITIAQWALESARGTHMAAPNNPFGMKAKPGQPSVTVRTREVFKGHSVYVMAAFRKFASLAEAFDAHGKLLATAPVYAHARQKLPDPFAFADALTGVYATDPHYGALLSSIIKGSNLTKYDLPSSTV